MSEGGAQSWAPLASVRILDLTRYVVGAITTRRLADLGADVVKIESLPGGDPVRRLPPVAEGAALWHELENAGKRSIAVDRGRPEDQGLVRRLAHAADVLVVNGAIEALTGFGLRPQDLRAARPDLVICLLSSFGADGPLAGQPAHGMNIDSQVGLARTAPGADGTEAFVPAVYGGWSNEVAAHNAALGIAAAVVGARSGQGGTVIEVSCYDAAVEANRMEIVFDLTAGAGLQETIGEHIWSARHRIYRTADDRLLYFSAVESASWRRFCAAVDRSDLVDVRAEDDAIDYGSADLANELAALFRSRPATEWARLFVEHRVPANCLLDAAGVAAAEHFGSRGLAAPPNSSGVRRIASPIRCHTAPFESAREAPELGAHRDDVLREWSAGPGVQPGGAAR